MAKRICSIYGCVKPAKSRGWCQMHYMRWRMHGDPLADHRRPRSRCTVDGCDKPAVGRGLCGTHYARMRAHGDPLIASIRVLSTRTCAIDGCERRHCARGWCAMHYERWQNHGDPNWTSHVSDADRFWARVAKGDGCWEWQPADGSQRTGPPKHQQISIDGHRIGAHVFSWILHNGPVPDGLEVCHGCDNPSCVRPDHLWVGSHIQNMADMRAKGRSRKGQHKTHCPQGHPYDEENTYVDHHGWYYCKTCLHKRRREAHERERQKRDAR